MGLSRTMASSVLAASSTEPVWPSSWAFQYWTILLLGSFLRAASKCLTACGDVAALELELGREHVAGRGFLPASADLGDHGLGGIQLVSLELEPGELHERSELSVSIGDALKQGAGLLIVLERIGLELGPHHDQVGWSGESLRKSARIWSASAGLPSLATRAASRPASSGLCGYLVRAALQPGSSFGLLALLFQRQDRELLGTRAALALAFAAHRCGRSPGRIRRAARRSGPAEPERSRSIRARRRSLSRIRPRPSGGRPETAGLVDLAAQQMKRRAQLARRGSRGDLLEERADDRLGLFRITGLEHGPCRPELVLGVQAAQPQCVLQELAAEVLLAREHQGNSVPRLGLGDLGQLGGGKLQMIDRARCAASASISARQSRELHRPYAPRPMPDWSSSIDPAKRVPEPLETRLGAIEQRLDVRRGLVETVWSSVLGKRHLDGDRCAGPSPHGSSSGEKPGAT